jgi:hypothetical protein
MIVDLADLVTDSKELQEIIIGDYPKPINKEKIYIDRSINPPVYSFFDLVKNELIDFLNRIEPNLKKDTRYEVRNPNNGKYISVRKYGMIFDNPKLIEKHLI